jgi:hypothetical protein
VATNCPMYPNYFNPQAPIQHGKPVNHSGIHARLQDYPAECLWAQLQWAREEVERGTRQPDDKYLENLENEWSKRDLCSNCLRELDHPFMTEVDELRYQLLVAKGKLKRIGGALPRLSESELRHTVSAILDEPDTRHATD